MTIDTGFYYIVYNRANQIIAYGANPIRTSGILNAEKEEFFTDFNEFKEKLSEFGFEIVRDPMLEILKYQSEISEE